MRSPARIYAEGLFNITQFANRKTRGSDAVIAEEIGDLAQTLGGMARQFRGANLPPTKLCELIREVVKDQVHPMTLEFCLLMIQRGYIKHLSAAAEHYRRLCGVADEIISLRVPFAPDEELAERLKARLADDGLIAHDIVDKAFFDVKLDRDLIGGFIAYYGGHQIDASIKTAITKFERLEGYAN